jgi:hypothetical protein
MQLREEALKLWPHLEDFWPFDPKYQIPTDDEFEELVREAAKHEFLVNWINRGPIEDCDNAALYSSAIIHHTWARMGKTDACPYGRAMGYKFRGQRGGHSLNIGFTQESGYKFADFDAGGRIWKASSENDHIFYLELS